MFMKYLFFLLLLAGLGYGRAEASVLPVLEGCDYRLETQNTPDGIPFFAIRDEGNSGNGGTVVFAANTSGWTYTWTYDGMEHQEGDYGQDSSSFRFQPLGEGVYTITAEKPGYASLESGEFRLFYVNVPSFKISLHDIYNCEEIKLTIDDFQPAAFVSGGVPFYGTQDVEYLLSGKETPWQFTSYQPATWEIPVAVNEENKRLSVTVTDKFGFEWHSQEAEYVSVIPLARFSADPQEGEAPLEVAFNNQSVNAGMYEWYLYKDSLQMPQMAATMEDSLITGYVLQEADPVYTYEHPGSYNVILKAINLNGNKCVSIASIEKYILVDTSLVDVPNVFTPNGDGINDVFRVKAQSLEYFHGVILNRWGRKVFEWHDPSQGWDGKIHGKYANPGTYYYVITARGREIRTKKYVKKGPILLVR